MEKCYVCGKRSYFKHLGRGICRNCFLRNIEKRVKKHLSRKLFKRKDKVLAVGELEGELLERAVGGMPLDIVFRKRLPKKISGSRKTKFSGTPRKQSSPTGFDWIVTGKTMDYVDEEFLSSLFNGKLKSMKIGEKVFNMLGEKISPSHKNIRKKPNVFNIFEVLTDEEVSQYAKLRKIKFKAKNGKRFLDSFKKFKEVKYNLYKNVKELRKLKFF
jgi:hypothetical protein